MFDEIIKGGDGQNAEFEKEWLKMEKYDFKILTLIAVLAENKLAYRGKIKDMCEFLGVKSGQSRTNKAIKDAIEKLEKEEYIYAVKDKQTYTLTLRVKAEKKREIIKIQKKWIEMVKSLDSKQTSWDTILRVWLYLIDNQKEIITNKDISNDLGISDTAVKRVKKVLVEDLKAIKCTNRSKKIAEGTYVRLGQCIDTFAWID